jgi:redox-sensing transcriptional repressor
MTDVRKIRKIPQRVIPRLSRYYRILFENSGQPLISSRKLSQLTGCTAAQIRRDLTYFGQFGSPGRGYNTEELKNSLKKILGIDRRWNVALIGVGNLGKALLGYDGFSHQGFNIVAAFDTDKRKAGQVVKGVDIHPYSRLSSVIKKKEIEMAILAVPKETVQSVATDLTRLGIKAILNFVPHPLTVPAHVKVRHIDMTIEIERLSFLVSRQ